MQAIATPKIPVEQLNALDEFAESKIGPELRDVLLSVSRCLRESEDVVVVDGDASITPSRAAKQLQMSRTHLYKLLDSGDIPSHRVGRDRRIRMRDIAEFEAQHQRDRRELAERFAHQRKTAAAADNEIAELL